MIEYFGVIGNRDYIKIRGERRPFWEFLDKQPDGWLTSLTYRRKDLPSGRPMIYDCGAWSYKDAQIPPTDSRRAADDYEKHAPPGSTVIAPDHMLIDGTDIDFRRAWNREQAERFLEDCPSGMKPMACIHGMELDERLVHAAWLESIGYRDIAIGGLAARASRKSLVTSWVKSIRQVIPSVRLHVLGLSSPDFMKTWDDFGVQSADGSSHFKQAFTGGAFFTLDEGKLKKHQAARPGNADDLGIVAPKCDCTACESLKRDGIDTRSYGSNENNMGRAAHNMNILMQAHDVVLTKTVGLVACAAKKKTVASQAKSLYVSDLFKKSKAWCEKNCDEWFILSAKHGLVHPESVLEPYNETLNEKTKCEREVWGRMVVEQLGDRRRRKYMLLAGNKYAEPLACLNADRPLEGLGIGKQLAWLAEAAKNEECTLF